MDRTLPFILCVILLLTSVPTGCNSDSSKSGKSSGIIDESGSTESLPLPSVPHGLVTTEERTAYVARHFWDSLDFRSDSLALDTAFMEQSFANFISVLAVAPGDAAREAVGSLDKMALASPKAFGVFSWVVEKYLDDPNSPMRDEELYMLFLEDLSDSAEAGEATRERARFRLDRARKNRRGTRAADFRFDDREGRATTLYKSLGDTATLLIFYDPDCPQCEEAKRALAAAPPAHGVKVLAIDIAGDRTLWESTKASMPEAWTVGFATDPLEEEETYVFPAMPTLYLLDPEGTVILKDPPLSTLLPRQQASQKAI